MKEIVVIADDRDSQIKAFIKIGGNELYKTLIRKNYKIPKSYIQWRELAANISAIAPLFNDLRLDLAQAFTAHRIALWVVKDAPIYCLDKQLLQQFQKTDIGDEHLIFRDLISQIPLHSLMILLPSKTIATPDGGYVDFLNIHCSDIRHPEWSEGKKYGLNPHYLKPDHDVILHFGCIDTKGTIWFCGWAINEDGTLSQRPISLGTAKANSHDNTFIQELRSLVMQCLMFLCFEKPEIDNVIFKETIDKTGGFTSSKEPKDKCLYPRWLRDKKENSQVRHIKETSFHSSHSSPSPHWRRGHWRRSAVGKGKTARKWNWIKPTFVAGDF